MTTNLPAFPNPFEEVPKTPFYLYDEGTLEFLYAQFRSACGSTPIQLRYSLKANDHPSLLKFFHRKGDGIDLVSGGELKLALAAGLTPDRLIFSGVGKTDEELELAVHHNIEMINIESQSEFRRLHRICETHHKTIAFALRINPDVDANTHPSISTGLAEHKFGLHLDEALDLYLEASKLKTLNPVGITMHIGSQIMDLGALHEATEKTINFTSILKSKGITLRNFDLGGGLGVSYSLENPLPDYKGYGELLQKVYDKWTTLNDSDAKVYCELGRALTAPIGILVTRVIALKETATKNFAIVDAGMNDLLRPALYEAYHPIRPYSDLSSQTTKLYDIVGPVCETTDTLGHARMLPELSEGDLLSITHAGAYCAVMGNTYNARPLAQLWWNPISGKPRL